MVLGDCDYEVTTLNFTDAKQLTPFEAQVIVLLQLILSELRNPGENDE